MDRCSLWQKLLDIGIDGKIFRVIQNMYSNSKSYVLNENNMSEFFNCKIGVRQGENLSPLLFSIFLNYLTNFMSDKGEGINIKFNVNNINYFLKLYTLLLYAV